MTLKKALSDYAWCILPYLHYKGRHTYFFFSGRTTKGVERVNPPDHYAKNHFFSLKSGCFSPKIGKKTKKFQNPFQAIITLKKREKKWHGPLSHWCREG